MDGVEGRSEGSGFAGDGDPFLEQKIAAAAFDGDDPDAFIHIVLFPGCPGDQGYLVIGCGKMHEPLKTAVQGMMGVV
jgi:hypothetical protein